jgi:hypothetical protein
MKKLLFIIVATGLFFLLPCINFEPDGFPCGRYKTDHQGKPFMIEFLTPGKLNGYYDGEHLLTGIYSISDNQFTWERDSYCEGLGYSKPTTYLWTKNEDDSLTFQLVGEDQCEDRKLKFDNKTYEKKP